MEIVYNTLEQSGVYTLVEDTRSRWPWTTINLHDYRTVTERFWVQHFCEFDTEQVTSTSYRRS
ncbi:hypothetical protein CHS0354_005840, partial [Potamilus streckersoni]